MNYTRHTSKIPHHGNDQHTSYNNSKYHNTDGKPSSSHFSHRSQSVKNTSNKSYSNHGHGSNNHNYKDTSTNDNSNFNIAKKTNSSSYHRAQSSKNHHKSYGNQTNDFNKSKYKAKPDTDPFNKSKSQSTADNSNWIPSKPSNSGTKDILKSHSKNTQDSNDMYKSHSKNTQDFNDIHKSHSKNTQDSNIMSKSHYTNKQDTNDIYKSQSKSGTSDFGKSHYTSKSKNSDFMNFNTSKYKKIPNSKFDDDDDDILPDINKTVKPKLRTKPTAIPKKIDLTTQEGRKEVADETVKILNSGKYTYIDKSGKSVEVDISTKIFNTRYSTKTYKPDYYDYFTLPSKGPMCKIEVRPESTFGAARRLCGLKLKTCALNFASATKPGGGFKNGKKAQEESLSRQSALYESIKYQKEMYQVHLANKYDNVYKDYMIYSEAVPVFRDDKTEQLLGPDEVFCTDVITSAAPWKAKIQEAGGDLSNLDKIISRRCEKILKCAIDNKVQALVLGAYGCGVFGNKPKDVSRIFKELLIDKEYGKYFKLVEFAITGPHSENFTEFTATFRPYLS